MIQGHTSNNQEHSGKPTTASMCMHYRARENMPNRSLEDHSGPHIRTRRSGGSG